MSLRAFHLLFILLVVLGADLFGVWSVVRYARGGDSSLLALGLVTILGGVGLVFYAIRFMRKMDAAGIH